MASLAEIRAKLKAQETRSERTGGGGNNAIFPHWNIPEVLVVLTYSVHSLLLTLIRRFLFL